MSQQAARQLRDAPYRGEHQAALVSRFDTAVRPLTLPAYLRWFEQALSQEMPDKLHAPGVWRDWGPSSVGGSALGSPRHSDAFRAYIEGSERATDDDGFYRTPLKAAMRYLAEGRSGAPLIARFLFRVARCGFDVRLAADGYTVCQHDDDEHRAVSRAVRSNKEPVRPCSGMPYEYAERLAEAGLAMLWTRYMGQPPRRDLA